jgi:hypothetical protein
MQTGGMMQHGSGQITDRPVSEYRGMGGSKPAPDSGDRLVRNRTKLSENGDFIRHVIRDRDETIGRHDKPLLGDPVRSAGQKPPAVAVIFSYAVTASGAALVASRAIEQIPGKIRHDDNPLPFLQTIGFALNDSADPFVNQRHRQFLGQRFRPPLSGKIPQVGMAYASQGWLNNGKALPHFVGKHLLLDLMRRKQAIRSGLNRCRACLSVQRSSSPMLEKVYLYYKFARFIQIKYILNLHYGQLLCRTFVKLRKLRLPSGKKNTQSTIDRVFSSVVISFSLPAPP